MVYRASALRGLAITQLVFGSLMIVFGIASIIAVHHWSSYAGFGIWVGIWVLISGILGYVGAKDNANPNKCLIGCFMGFSITACVITGIMFICYCVALGQFSHIMRCQNYYSYYYSYHSNIFCYSKSKRYEASVGAGLGSCQLIYSIVVFFVALASAIYCCNAVCCGAPAVGAVTNQQVMYVGPQQVYPGGQSGVVVIQPSGAVATVSHGYSMAGQQTFVIPPQPIVQQPAGYWAVPAGAMPGGAVPAGANPYPSTAPMSYAGATAPSQGGAQQAMKSEERPPPYSYGAQTGNAPPSMTSEGGVTDVPGVMTV
ncbi:hypothetical protein ABFA07_018079 [Porites harrisoni]